ncbi:MAG: SGNH/GDSL hydrolase family protein, partial [Planctomycetaceae bacterium]
GTDPFEVLNFGAESWTTVESLINYSVRGVHAHPDYVVIYHAVNDVVAASHPQHITPEPDYSHWRKRLRRPPTNTMSGLPLAFDRLAVICLTRNILYRNQAEHTWANSICNYPFRGDHEFQGTSTFRKNIESLVSIALRNGATAVLVTQVHSPDHSRQRCGNDSGIERVTLMNNVLREVAARHMGVERVILVDAAKEADRLKLYDEMTDWCHFSSKGYTRLGHFIAGQMYSR